MHLGLLLQHCPKNYDGQKFSSDSPLSVFLNNICIALNNYLHTYPYYMDSNYSFRKREQLCSHMALIIQISLRKHQNILANHYKKEKQTLNKK